MAPDMKRAVVGITVCLGLAAHEGGANSVGGTEPMSLCSVVANVRAYDGKEIVLKAQYRLIFHGSLLSSPECDKPETKVNLRDSAHSRITERDRKLLAQLTRKHLPAQVVVRGVFKVARMGQCFGQDCDPFELEATEWISVEPVHENQRVP
jgi:hypothetical protein